MEEQNSNVEVRFAEEVLTERFAEYSRYVLKDRALPSVQDGLKPSQRRIIYGMFMKGSTYEKPFTKSAKSVGSIMGELHPHGDSSIYSAMVRMGQDWLMSAPLVEIHGNKGSIDGDSPAAMRYTESRLTRLASVGLLEGIRKKGIVPTVMNFDDTLLEPVVLPVKIPNLLINGSSGISTGYKTEIPTHNLKECLNGAIALLENPELTVDELMQIIPAPDFPTGGVITSGHNLKDYFTKGIGRIIMRSSYHIEEDKKFNYIILDSLPYKVLKTTLLQEIELITLADKKDKVVGLLNVVDESDLQTPIRIKITCDKKVDPKLILGFIFSSTSAQTSFPANMVAVVDGKPTVVGVMDMLKAFNEFRIETVRKSLVIDREKYEKNLHIIEGCIKLADIINEVVEEIKLATSKENASKRIQKEFEFTAPQAEYIVNMRLHQINRTDKKANIKKEKELKTLIKGVNALLTSDKKLKAFIIQDYLDIINDEEFGVDRRTEIVLEDESWEVSKLDTVDTIPLMVGVSKMGYIKTSQLRSYNTTESVDLLDGDYPLLEKQATNKDFLVIFTNKCNYLYIPLLELEESKWKLVGKHIATLVTGLEDGEEIINAFVINPKEDGEKFFFTAKSDGKVKRTKVSEHSIMRKFFSTYSAIKRKDDDELVLAQLVDGDEGYVGFADSQDKKMSFSLAEVAPKGLKTDGMRGIFLKNDEKVSEAKFSLDKEELITEGFVEKTRGSRGSK